MEIPNRQAQNFELTLFEKELLNSWDVLDGCADVNDPKTEYWRKCTCLNLSLHSFENGCFMMNKSVAVNIWSPLLKTYRMSLVCYAEVRYQMSAKANKFGDSQFTKCTTNFGEFPFERAKSLKD